MEQRQLIARLNTPGQAKRAGNNLVLRPDWEEVKIPIMRELLKQKFSNRALMYKLRQTKGELIEGNNWGDTFWGVCKGQGENHLGRLLMEIRDS
jgi:predicted NAD-dependent protein-ADP-ribosyltransferase YbiA (DUF1768 family)